MKRIAIILAGSGEIRDVTIQPGTTPQDVLGQLGLAGYFLSKDPSRNRLGDDENLYPLVEPGDKIYAASKTDVGNRARSGGAA
jgi:hypothetical protein